MVAADRPAPVPRNCSIAGAKSWLDRPCRYSNGSTSATLGDLRDHTGRIAEENRCRCPVTGSTRLSFTRGATTGTAPAPVSTSRSWRYPLRTTSRWPFSSRTSAYRSMCAATSASNAAASIRRAPSRTSSSSSDIGAGCSCAPS